MITDSQLPIVLPRYEYSYFGTPDLLGGRFSMSDHRLQRDAYRRHQHPAWRADSELGAAVLRQAWAISGSYHCTATPLPTTPPSSNLQPNFGPFPKRRPPCGRCRRRRWTSTGRSAQQRRLGHSAHRADRAGDRRAADRATARFGSYPNEDSLDFEFSDANLFGFNNSPAWTGWTAGRGRTSRCTAPGTWAAQRSTGWSASHTAPTKDDLFPVASGLRDQVSDIVARSTFSPTKWLDLTYRTRLDSSSSQGMRPTRSPSVGVPRLRVTAATSTPTPIPYSYYDQPAPPPAGNAYYFPRNEITLGASSNWGYYRFSGSCRRDLEDQPDWSRSVATPSTRTNASSLICEYIAAIRASTETMGPQRSCCC